MSSIDERIVKMQFDNETFKKKALETKGVLGDVNKAVDAAGKGKGLLDLNSNMEKISVTASKMSVITTTALATIANKATNVGLQLASSLTLNPIKAGFSEYESLLSKQNVIMNATGKSADEVKKTLNELNEYSDKTIFSFGDMTEALTTFVNAGVSLPDATTAMRGIANASALAGASTQEAQSSFRAFGQALGQGFLGLQDFRQASITGKIGTVQFKQALIDAAVEQGTLTKRGKEYVTNSGKVLTATKNFDMTLQEQWANTEVLNAALREYGDENTKLGKKATKASQEVRSFTAFMDTLKESLASGWAQVFTRVFGGLEESTKMWTGLSTAVTGVTGSLFHWLDTTLKVWRQMGGFSKLMGGFANILSPIAAIFGTIGKAYRAAFPNSDNGAGKGLFALSSGFEMLTKPLRLVAWLIEQLAAPLTLVFQLVKIGGAVIRAFIGTIADLVKGAIGLVDIDVEGGGFLQWVKDLGSALVSPIDKISDLLSKGKSLGEAFKSISMPDLPSFSLPGLPSMPDFGGGAAGAVGGGGEKAVSGLEKVKSVLSGIGKVLKSVAKVAKQFVSDLFSTGDEIGSVFGKIGDFIVKIGDGIKFIFEKIDWENVLASFNLAVFATFMLTMSRMFNAISNGIGTISGLGQASVGVLEQTGNALKSFQTAARAKLILNIGIAVALLAASLWVLSKIPAGKLATSLTALGAIFLMLNLTMKSFTKLIESLDGKKTGVTALALSVAIVALALAMFLMAGALLLMNKVEWGSLIKGLVTMFALVKAMEVIGNLAARAAKNMVAGAFAIGVMAGAMLVMAGALIAFKLVDWESMAKAGVVLAALTLALLGLQKVNPATLLNAGIAMLAISVGMVAMSAALIAFALVKWQSIGKLAVVLAALALSLGLMMAIGGPVAVSGMIGLGVGLIFIAGALLMLNKVDWSSILKLFAVLTIAVVALAALGIVAYFVGPALIMLGAAMALMGAGLLLMATAMAIALPLAALGTAAFAAFATGAALAIAAFLQSLALQAPIMKDSILKILQALIDTVVEATPMIIQGFKDLWKAIKDSLFGGDKKKEAEDGGKGAVQAIGKGVDKEKPSLIKKGLKLILSFLDAVGDRAKEFGQAAGRIVAGLLRGLANKADAIVQGGVDLVVKLAEGIGNNLDRLVQAGINLIADWLYALADGIRGSTGVIGPALLDVGKAIFDVGVDIVEGLGKGILSLADKPKEWIMEVVGKLPWWAKKILKIKSPSRVFMEIGKFLVMGLTNGIQDNASSAIVAVASMVGGQIAVASAYISKFIQDLDQKALAARARADGLAKAAERAAKAAEATKSKEDDAYAANLQQRADRADKAATSAEAKAEKAREDQARKEEFAEASLIEKARIRSQDAQDELDRAKEMEQKAARKVVQAEALDRAARGAGVTAAQRRAMEAEADALRASAVSDAKSANVLLDRARKSAADALRYQKLAGAEAAAAFQEAFEADAKSAADEEAFSKLSNQEKADLRRKQAEELQKKAEEDLAAAKRLAYTDIEAANELAAIAMQEAEQARRYLEEAEGFSTSTSGGGVLGTVVNLDPTDDAAVRMRDYEESYSTAVAAAAGDRSIEFNQYNTSPEALSPTEIYRRTNNQFTFAVEKIDEVITPAA